MTALLLVPVLAASCTNFQNKECSCSCREKKGEDGAAAACSCCECCPGFEKQTEAGAANGAEADGSAGVKLTLALPDPKEENGAGAAGVTAADAAAVPENPDPLQAETTPKKTRQVVDIHVNTDIIHTDTQNMIPGIQMPDISTGQKYNTMWRNGDTAY